MIRIRNSLRTSALDNTRLQRNFVTRDQHYCI